MFRRNGLPTQLLTAVLAIAMAWATTPTQGLAEALGTTPQTQTTTSASNDATSDASTSKPTPTGEKNQEATPSKSTTTGSDSSSSNDGEKAGAADEKDSKSNDNSGAAALAAPAAPSQDTSDNKDGQSTFTAHWTNAPDKEISYTNAGFKKDDSNTWTDFSCTPSENTLHKSTLKVYLKLAGDSKTKYKAGSVKIYVPAGFYRGLDKDDPLLVACEDNVGKGTPLEQVSWMIPKAPSLTVTDFNYTEEMREVDGQQVKYNVIQNAKELNGATELDLDIDYRFRPTMLDVRQQTQADGSDMGVYEGSFPVSCEISDSEVARKIISVKVLTKVNSSSLTLTHTTEDPNKGIYFSWDDAWGSRPVDANRYFYIIWYITYNRDGKSTMPYKYSISVDSAKAGGGELIGAQKYTSQRDLEAYATPGIINSRLDTNYTGISGNAEILKNQWIGISNSPTKTDSAYSGMLHANSISGGYNYQIYALLMRYPLKMVKEAIANGVDMAKDGITISNGVKLSEQWQDGHEVSRDYGPTGDLAVKSLPDGGTARGITKARQNAVDRTYTVQAAQSLLEQGHSISLPDYVISSYNYDNKAKWNSESSTYSSSTGFEAQDGSYYLFSAVPSYFGKNPSISNISANDPIKLTDNEYRITSFYVNDQEYDATYTEGLGWQRSSRPNNDLKLYEPIEILIRRAGSSKFEEFGTVVKAGSTYTLTKKDGSKSLSVGSNSRAALPSDTVQIKMKQNGSRFFASDVSLRYSLRIIPDDRIEQRLKQDISNGINSAIGGFASGSQLVEGKEVATFDETAGQYWHLVSYELGPIYTKTAFIKETDQSKLSDSPNNLERTLPVSVSIYNGTNVWGGSEYGNTRFMKNYIPQSGVFCDLLPAGTYTNADEVTVGLRTGSAFGVITPNMNHDVKFIKNWNGSGRTLLKVTYSLPEKELYAANYWSGLGIRLNYILHDSYTNIVDRGGRVTNSVIFINTSGKDSILHSNAEDSSYTGKGFDDWTYFKDSAQRAWAKGYQVATTQAVMDFNNVTALQAGFSSRVSTDINPVYQSSGFTYLGDRYIDCLQYTSASDTRTDNAVLYDVFSPEDNNAVGSFESIDVSSIEAKPTCDSTGSKTEDTCRPVVWYSTSVPTDKTRSLDSGIWSKTPPKDPSAVRAVAVDCRKTDSGKDFVLDKKGTLVAYVHLKATADASRKGRTEKNEALISKRMFTGAVPAPGDMTTVQTANRTVKLLAADLSIEKTCDPKSGTVESPAEIGNDANKQLTYTIKVTNNAQKSDSLPDVTRIHVKDVLPKGMALDSDSDMKVESSSLGVAPGTKIDSQSVVSYQTGSDGVSFDISKLPSEGSVSITVPVVRKDPVKKTTMYVNTATIETIGNATDGQSSSTYHKTSVTTMPLAGAGGFAGLVVAGCVVLGASAFAWVRRRRHE
ncbi:hypothetical protein ACTQ13_01105 [Parafannyhessea sp. LCP21S3_E6]|uniref:hypothetical protein n=1 Tax=Parafannyhessea sp. LCP21S3_E6 TaxID=3438796 RepID=UPI003F94B3AD